ncbi:hypothetical protein A0H81_10113 [Grifola frondosa]|uniref:Uncharacterized protein n=1 Tax=Grifola frondosa TaxID=5627 RepID=A0A1C7LY29_GRIFR|nr:hypothetical protein A0H81_10113 [Grifola frondosa]
MSAPVLHRLEVLGHFWRPTENLKAQGVESLKDVAPLYECRPPWWGRWTYFVSLIPQDESPSGKGTSADDTSQVMGHYELRPLWQRGSFAIGQLVLGLSIAVLLMGGRSRIVHKMYILPPAAPAKPTASLRSEELATRADARRLVVRSPYHFDTQGRVFPLRDVTLSMGKNDTDMSLQAKNIRGEFWLGLQSATVEGKKLSLRDAKERLFTIWYGEKRAKRAMLDMTCVSGPVLGAGSGKQ